MTASKLAEIRDVLDEYQAGAYKWSDVSSTISPDYLRTMLEVCEAAEDFIKTGQWQKLSDAMRALKEE